MFFLKLEFFSATIARDTNTYHSQIPLHYQSKTRSSHEELFFLLVICCTVISFSADKSYAQKIVLNAAEVSQLFVNKTMNVVGDKTDKRTGDNWKYKAYTSEMGGLLVIFESGARQNRTWSVQDDGAFCIGRDMGRRTGGSTCGYIVPEGNGVYKMYKAKHVWERDGRVVGGKQIKLLVTFSNLQEGNKL